MVEKRTFEGGMNLDLEERLIPTNQYRYALNIRLSDAEESAMGVITNEKGTTLVSFSLPTGINTCIGWFDDINEKRLYYIVHNSNGDNLILAYDYVSNEILTVLADKDNVLNLSAEKYITAIEVIQGNEDDFLVFSDDAGEPKVISIEAGIRRYSDGFVPSSTAKFKGTWNSVNTYNEGDVVARSLSGTLFYYISREDGNVNNAPTSISSVFPTEKWDFAPEGYVYDTTASRNREDFFTLIVKPPQLPPVCSYDTDVSLRVNALKGSFFQFKYKYVLADGRESAWSPISERFLPTEFPDSIISEDKIQNNVISVEVERPIGLMYKSIKIAVRRNNNDLSPDDWYIVKAFRVNDADSLSDNFTNKVYNFTNTDVLTPIDQSEANQLQSWIPRRCKAIALTSENRVVLGNFTEGYSIDLYKDRGINDTEYSPNIVAKDYDDFSVPTVLKVNQYDFNTLGASVEFLGDGSSAVDYYLNGYSLLLSLPQRSAGNIVSMGIDIRLDNNIHGDMFFSYQTSVVLASNNEDECLAQVRNALHRQIYVKGTKSGGWIESHIVEANIQTYGGNKYVEVRLLEYNDTRGFFWSTSFNIRMVSASTIGTGSEDPNDFRSPVFNTQRAFVRPVIKLGGTQQFALAYSDSYGRISNAITVPSMTYTDNYVGGSIEGRYLDIILQHEAPEWADKWHLLKNKDNGVIKFIQFPLARMARPNNGSVTNPLTGLYFRRGWWTEEQGGVFSVDLTLGSNREIIYISLSSILKGTRGSYGNLFTTDNTYSYSKGDRIRLISFKDLNGDVISPPVDFDVEIAYYNEEFQLVGIFLESISNIYTNSTVSTNNSFFQKANENGSIFSDFNVLFEVYTPSIQKGQSLYYEIYTGIVKEESRFGGGVAKFHADKNGVVRNTGIFSAARKGTVVQYLGDVYKKPRLYPSVIDSGASSTRTFGNYVVESSSFYDKYDLKTEQLGRPNRTEVPRTTTEILTGSVGEFKRNVTIRYTLPYNPETGFNGIGTALDTSFIDASQNHGSIQRLYGDGQRLLIYQVNKRGYSLAGQNIITGLDGNTNLAQADTPLSKVQYYTQEYGISNDPESFAVSGTNRYFVDINRAVVCREGENGVFPISDYGIKNYMIALSKKALGSDFFSVRGFFDEGSECYFVTFRYSDRIIQTVGAPPVGVNFVTITATGVLVGSKVFGKYGTSTGGNPTGSGTINGIVTSVASTSFQIHIDSFSGSLGDTIDLEVDIIKAETLSFSERYNAWESFHSFVSDTMGSAGVNFCSWQGGQLYIHNNASNMGRFYGIDYDSYFDVVSNAAPDVVKSWLTTDVATNLHIGDSVPLSVPSSATEISDNVMSSGVYTSMGDWSTTLPFKYKEGQLDAAYMRAKSVPASDYIEGRKVRGYWQKTRFKINGNINKVVKFFVAKFNFIPSMHTN